VRKRVAGIEGVWRRNGRKAVHVKQGDLGEGQVGVHAAGKGPKSRKLDRGVRVPIGARKRL
jgi:hypothetical protein